MTRILGAIFALIILFSANAAHAACTSPAGVAGAIIYNTTQRIFEYCDDTNWKRMNILPGTGSGGCTSPTLAEGQMVFNQDHRLLQGCAGNVHRPFTPLKSSGGVNNWRQVSAGGGYDYEHACAIKSDNSLWCWGANGSGELGDNTTTQRNVPTAISGGGSWKMVASGVNHTCAIKFDNSLWCWGGNGGGQLGDNTGTNKSVPTAVDGGGTWKFITAGSNFSCGIKTDDTLWCWGTNDNGRTALNTGSGAVLVPTQVNGGGSWKWVSAGDAHGCGIRSDDTLRCWGFNGNGRTGLGTNSGDTLTATAVSGGGTWKQVVASFEHSCGIRSDDTMRCWGHNWLGHIGDNTTTERLVPTTISGGGTWKQVGSNYAQHTCAVKSDNSLWCWGFAEEGQLGDGVSAAYSLVPVTASDPGPWSQVSAGGPTTFGYTCGIKTNGSMLCWGSNTQGQLGNNKTSYVPAPMAANAGGSWLSVATGSTGSACSIRGDNSLWCWGDNGTSQLGDGTSTQRNIPTAISGGGSWTQVSFGDLHACGIKADQTLWCWGSNFSGQVGDNTQYNSYNIPTAVSGGGTWKYVSAGGTSVLGFTCGIKTDDTLWCWGENGNGRTGLNTAAGQTLVPTQINGGGTWKSVITGYQHACGIRSDDTMRCWGDNGNGQIGDNTSGADRLVPTTLSGGGTWKLAALAGNHTCGIRSDDTMRCWGHNGNGQLGDNTFVDRLVPTTLSGGGTWKRVSASGYSFGGSNTCGIKTDDTMWCWGTNGTGALGTNVLGGFPQGAPVAVSGGATWKEVSIKGSNNTAFGCAIKSDDTIWCWGSNMSGQLTETPLSGPSQPSPTLSWCNNPLGSPGAILFNSAFNLLQFCDGAGWVGIRGGVTPPIAEGIPTLGLLAYWAFDETAGTTATDTSGNSNNGTLINGPTWVAGHLGNAISFDGTNDHVSVPHASSLNISSSHTISAWVRPTTIPAGYITLLSKSPLAAPNYWLETINSNQFLGGFHDAGGGYPEYFTPNDIVPGLWYHIAIMLDDTANRYKVYVNGMKVTDAAETQSPDPTTGALFIGSQDSGAQFYNGLIDELRIYNRALTDAEIQALAAQ